MSRKLTIIFLFAICSITGCDSGDSGCCEEKLMSGELVNTKKGLIYIKDLLSIKAKNSTPYVSFSFYEVIELIDYEFDTFRLITLDEIGERDNKTIDLAAIELELDSLYFHKLPELPWEIQKPDLNYFISDEIRKDNNRYCNNIKLELIEINVLRFQCEIFIYLHGTFREVGDYANYSKDWEKYIEEYNKYGRLPSNAKRR